MDKKTTGVSIVVCSIDPALCEKLKSNIAETIGVEFEFIVFDNRHEKWGICKVYNHCAKKAVYPYLCFIHEDIKITTKEWGAALIEFAQSSPDCGVIGIAGGTVAYRNFTAWGNGAFVKDVRHRFWQYYENRAVGVFEFEYYNPDNVDFPEVITLDGCFLFTAQNVYAMKPFDEDTFPGFHFYDADFTFGIAQIKKNYVCCKIDVYHSSKGSYNADYYKNVKKFQIKWKDALPQTVESKKINTKCEVHTVGSYIVACLRTGGVSGCIDSISHSIKMNGYLFFVKVVLYSFTYLILKKVGCKKSYE